jgi:alpha-mannosidase
MHKHPDLTRKRIQRFIEQRLKPAIYPETMPMKVAIHRVCGEPIVAQAAMQAEYEPFVVGSAWGPLFDTAWFRFRARVPEAWQGKRVVALVDLGYGGGEGFGAEGLAYRDGRPFLAVNVHRKEVPWTRSAGGGEPVAFFVEAAANVVPDEMEGGIATHPDYGGRPLLVLKQAELAYRDEEVWGFYHDMLLCRQAVDVLPTAQPRAGRLLFVLNEVINLWEAEGRAALERCRGLLAPLLACRNGDSAHEISAVGHAHIDTAWLWPLRETIRKCARTFSTALEYMKEYPDYVFVCSQAVQYAWMKALYPDIYEGIREAVRRGQWEPVGSMWVEADCNIPSGESLVRQILHGKRFFMQEFGYETEDVWIPDVFGYSASFPQLMRQAGIDSFLTQKISWSQFNRFPHHTFLWEGIDGTRIFTHFPPSDTYNGNFEPGELAGGVAKFLDHDRATRSLYIYGYGDGGGGPSLRMLENAQRLTDFEGLPRVTLERASDFFRKAKADAVDLPVWVGELYLELHRGTYTTQARVKRGNRLSECWLRDAEFVDVLATAVGDPRQLGSITPTAPPRAVYDVFEHPAPEERNGRAGALDRAWKLLLMNQFHDIIPGSSIQWVYRDSELDYQTIHTLAQQVWLDASSAMVSSMSTGSASKPVAAWNSLAWERTEVVELDDGRPVVAEVPACGYAIVDAATADRVPEGWTPVTVEESGGRIVLDNGLIRLELDEQGLVSGLRDLQCEREVIPAGARGNLLQLHPDDPNQWEAWDVDLFYKEVFEEIVDVESIEVLEAGGLRAVVRVVRKFGGSTMDQRLVVRAGSKRIDFETNIDWQERKRFLKVAFPVDVRSQRATYEIQYGHLERPTHMNTSWDLARFEVCAHKWADLSEPGYGVALLNDCKYGHDIFGNTMRLSLLRGPGSPDPDADRGRHRFTYALLPHHGDLRQAGVIQEGYALNQPIRLQSLAPHPVGEGEPSRQSWLSIDGEGIVLEAMKVAEEGEGIVLRLYEAFGSRCDCRLNIRLPFRRVDRVDLLERTQEQLACEAQTVELHLKPFEIVTLKLV